MARSFALGLAQVLQLTQEQPWESHCLARARVSRWEGEGKPQCVASLVAAPSGGSTSGRFGTQKRTVHRFVFSSCGQS
jgi:hypothetical protein